MKKFIFLIVSVIISIILLEGVLFFLAKTVPDIGNLLSRQPKVTVVAPQISDDILGHRPNPAYSDHDELGFRNRSVLKNIDILTLGDSQTYGTGVKREQTWPSQLGRILSTNVYNMAYAGYGPTHSLVLLKEAVKLKPRLIIEAFYAGNDLYDSFQGVYNNGQFPEFRNPDQKIVSSIRAMESESAFKDEVDLLAPHLNSGGMSSEDDVEYVSSHGRIRNLTAEHSKIYGVFRALKRAVKHYKNRKKDIEYRENWELIKKNAMQRPEKFLYPVVHGRVKTLLTPDYRLAAINLDDLRLREGLRISLMALREMSEVLNAEGIDFLVVLIPTKELVFKDAAEGVGGEAMSGLLNMEEMFWQTVKSYLSDNSIPYHDLLPVLRSRTNDGIQLYPMDWDGHPNPAGYQVIAENIAEELNKNYRELAR